MKVTDRIRAFLNDRPVRSDASGMFIERDDLRKLLEEVEAPPIHPRLPDGIESVTITANDVGTQDVTLKFNNGETHEFKRPAEVVSVKGAPHRVLTRFN